MQKVAVEEAKRLSAEKEVAELAARLVAADAQKADAASAVEDLWVSLREARHEILQLHRCDNSKFVITKGNGRLPPQCYKPT